MINSFEDLATVIKSCKGDASKTDWHQYGQVNVQQKDDLILFSYMATCQFKKPEEWSWFERVSRGLVMNIKGEIIARPFDKFWNYGEVLPAGKPVEVTEKMDGSLIIVFAHKGGIRAITRGSFDSEQAQWASQYIKDHLDLRFLLADTRVTLLFEAIYPDNRIVVDYEGREDLVLLGVRNVSGEGDWWYSSVKFLADSYKLSQPKTYEIKSVEELLAMAKTLGPEHEGWVVRYNDGTRVKIKGATYLELHKWIGKLTSKMVAKAMVELQLEEVYESCPAYIKDDLDAIVETVEITIRQTKEIVVILFNRAPKTSRKEFALWVNEQAKGWSRYLFALYDDRFTTEMILKKEYGV